MAKLMWRIRFVLYGQKRCPLGYAIWWAWSDTNYEDYSSESPIEIAQEELYALADLM